MPETEEIAAFAKLASFISDAKICMLTTVESDGHLRSRPMALQETEFTEQLWFFTALDSGKVAELEQDSQVNLSIMHGNTYVSISGRARIVQNRRKAEELWSPLYKTWFPGGLDDPNLALLVVTIDKAEYWTSPGGIVTTLIGFAKSVATGEPAEVGENRKLNVA